MQAFEAGDPLARRVVTGAGRYMGQAVPGLMGALNVQRIVIAGEMARFGPPLLDVIRETMPRTTLARLAGETSVDFEHLGHNEIILGASALILRDYSLAFRRQPGRPEGHVERGPPQSAGPVVPDRVMQGVPTTGRRAGARAAVAGRGRP